MTYISVVRAATFLVIGLAGMGTAEAGQRRDQDFVKFAQSRSGAQDLNYERRDRPMVVQPKSTMTPYEREYARQRIIDQERASTSRVSPLDRLVR